MKLQPEQKKQLLGAADNCTTWMREKMMLTPDGKNGIWERVRINMDEIVYWVRSDCTTDAAMAFLLKYKATGDTEARTVAVNLLQVLFGMQTLRGGFPFYQYSAPDVTKHDLNINGGAGFWPNDNGKLLGLLSYYADEFPELPIKERMERVCRYFIATQNAEGWWNMNATDYPGTCFQAWSVYGMSYAARLIGDEAAKQCALKGVEYLKSLQLPGGRMKTSYEINKVENWRPVSSEAAESLLAFCAAQEALGVDCTEQIDRLIAFLGSLTHECGGIHNCDDTCLDASEQNDANLTDLVYTTGYALQAWLTAYRVTGREECKTYAQRLALFLAKIQCKNENPLWDGGWRGSYDMTISDWKGRADQQNELDEGGMYSVYTGWCAATNTQGLLAVAMLD